MAKKPRPPAPVLVVDDTFGLTGIRVVSGRRMQGNVVLVMPILGVESLPDDLVPSEIHVHIGALNSPFQIDNRDRMVEALMERMTP